MKKILFNLVIVAAIIFGMTDCSNRGGGSTDTPEANLTITTNPPANTTQPPAPQTDFPITVTVTSTMPPQGVTIEVKAAPDGSSTTFFTETKSSTSASTNFTITGTPVGPVCVVTVTVTSKTKATNTASATFRYSRK